MVVNRRGIKIDISIEGDESLLILAGWWSVFHQSTEYLIIGRLIDPNKTKTDVIFSPTSILSKDLLIMIIIQ